MDRFRIARSYRADLGSRLGTLCRGAGRPSGVGGERGMGRLPGHLVRRGRPDSDLGVGSGVSQTRLTVPPNRLRRNHPTIAAGRLNPPVRRDSREFRTHLRYPVHWQSMTGDPEQIDTIAESISAARRRPPPDACERFPPGALLASRYRIISRLGKGGMGEVFRADDLILRQPVALKFLPESARNNVNLLTRFYDEVRI